ncbi:MAG: hypothetical protein WAM71_01875 [Candidatus Korobacteraceae bacterium]
MKCAAAIVVVFVCLAGMTLHAQIPQFQHIIVIVQENRTPDNLCPRIMRAAVWQC